jgi:hypothetical protein
LGSKLSRRLEFPSLLLRLLLPLLPLLLLAPVLLLLLFRAGLEVYPLLLVAEAEDDEDTADIARAVPPLLLLLLLLWLLRLSARSAKSFAKDSGGGAARSRDVGRRDQSRDTAPGVRRRGGVG